MQSVRSKISVAVLGLVLAGSLAGCTGGSGQAVVGNGFSYSEADVSTVIAEYAELTGETASRINRSSVVFLLGEATTFSQLAEEMGVALTDEEVESSIASIASNAESQESSLTVDDLSDVTLTVLEASLLSAQVYTSLTTEYYERFRELLIEAEVEVSPRYGTIQEGYVLEADPLGDVLSDTEKMLLGMSQEELESLGYYTGDSTETNSTDSGDSTDSSEESEGSGTE